MIDTLPHQFLCMMTSAWQVCADMKLGIFAPDIHQPDPLAKAEMQKLKPEVPEVGVHQIWTKVNYFVLFDKASCPS